MDVNPYEAPRTVECVRRPLQYIPRSVWIAFAVIIPLAIANLVHAAIVLVTG